MPPLSLAYLATALLAWQQAPADPQALIEQLGSPRYAERQDATASLRTLGRAALPALREARKAADPEVAERAADLVEAIETEMLVQPTLVTLDFQERPLTEIVAELSRRGGMEFRLLPEQHAAWQRKITLQSDQPVTYWALLDQLARRARVRVNPGNGGIEGGQPTVQLVAGLPDAPPPTFDTGPFRVQLSGIHYHIDRMLGGGRPVELRADQRKVEDDEDNAGNRTVQFYLDLSVQAEPRMSLAQGGPLKVLEAVDDRGQSLLSDQSGVPQSVRVSGFFGISNGQNTVQTQMPLTMPAKPGQVIRRLRGRLPVMLSTRKDQPLVVPLAEAAGKTFETEDASLSIQQVGPAPDNQPGQAIELTLNLKRVVEPALAVAGNQAPNFFVFRGGDIPQTQFELADEKGRVVRRWYPASSSNNNQQLQMRIQVMPDDETGPVTELRYYSLIRTQTEVEFDFQGIPMP